MLLWHEYLQKKVGEKKSVNLQFNTLGCLEDGTNESLTMSRLESDVTSIILFFMISCKILCKNPFNLFSYFFYKIKKIEINCFEFPIKSIRKIILGTSDSWFDDLFVPSFKQPSVIYCRLTDLKTNWGFFEEIFKSRFA